MGLIYESLTIYSQQIVFAMIQCMVQIFRAILFKVFDNEYLIPINNWNKIQNRLKMSSNI